MVHPVIHKLEAIEPLTNAERDKIAGLIRDVSDVPRKTDIISDGESPDYVHLVLDGWAARYKILRDGSRRITAFLIPGDFCDLHITILDAVDHGIIALTDCRVAYIEQARIDEVTRSTPVLTRALWRATLVDEAILRQWLVNGGRRNALEAVAHLLSELHLRMKLVGLAEDDKLELPVTQEELADATGLTPVHINRTLQRLRKEGLIELSGGTLFVPDVQALRRACDFDSAYLHPRSIRHAGLGPGSMITEPANFYPR
jgi:CRP-like cAMP-binding protein